MSSRTRSNMSQSSGEKKKVAESRGEEKENGSGVEGKIESLFQ